MSLIKCPECGKEISDKAAHCVNCGYSLAWEEQRSGHEKRKLIVITITVIIVAVLCVSGVMIYKHYNDSNAETDIKNQQVEDVINAIAKLDEITINDRAEIDRINVMYSSLSDEDKKLVTNYDRLMTANNKMAMLSVDDNKESTTTEKQTEQKNDIDLDGIYRDINKILKQADDTYTSFLNVLQYSGDQVKEYNNNLSKLNSTKQSLDQAYKLCGDHKELQSLKKKIQTAKYSLPVSKVKNVDEMLDQLNKHEQFSYDLYNAQLEVAQYLDKN